MIYSPKFFSSIDRLNGQLRAFGDANDVLTRALTKSEAEKGSLETNNRVEKEFRQRLQTALNDEKEKVSQLHFDIHELTLMKQVRREHVRFRCQCDFCSSKEYEKYKTDMSKKLTDYEAKFEEQERAIQELAMKLEMSLKREDEFREKDELRSSTWMKDVKVKECGQCRKEFGTLRRKHHCRK